MFCGWMQIRMLNSEVLTGEQINDFLRGTEGVILAGQNRKEVYGWVESVLVAQEFLKQDKKLRGTIREYLEKVTAAAAHHGK